MYIVKSLFVEEGHSFKVGDSYPLQDTEVSEERVKYLLKPFEGSKFSFIEKAMKEAPETAEPNQAEIIETLETPFKGAKETQLRKLAEENEIEISEEYSRDQIIEVLLEAGITSL